MNEWMNTRGNDLYLLATHGATVFITDPAVLGPQNHKHHSHRAIPVVGRNCNQLIPQIQKVEGRERHTVGIGIEFLDGGNGLERETPAADEVGHCQLGRGGEAHSNPNPIIGIKVRHLFHSFIIHSFIDFVIILVFYFSSL